MISTSPSTHLPSPPGEKRNRMGPAPVIPTIAHHRPGGVRRKNKKQEIRGEPLPGSSNMDLLYNLCKDVEMRGPDVLVLPSKTLPVVPHSIKRNTQAPAPSPFTIDDLSRSADSSLTSSGTKPAYRKRTKARLESFFEVRRSRATTQSRTYGNFLEMQSSLESVAPSGSTVSSCSSKNDASASNPTPQVHRRTGTLLKLQRSVKKANFLVSLTTSVDSLRDHIKLAQKAAEDAYRILQPNAPMTASSVSLPVHHHVESANAPLTASSVSLPDVTDNDVHHHVESGARSKYSPPRIHTTLGLCVGRHPSRFGAALATSPKLRPSRRRGFVVQDAYFEEGPETCEPCSSSDASAGLANSADAIQGDSLNARIDLLQIHSATGAHTDADSSQDMVSPTERYLPGIGRRTVLRRPDQLFYTELQRTGSHQDVTRVDLRRPMLYTPFHRTTSLP
jgi:hypothetical protein